jgi:hypothetical protein
MAQYKRKQLFVDARVQGSLIRRVVIYWLACVITVEFLNLSWQIAIGPEQPSYFSYLFQWDWRSAAARLVFSAILLVPITFDMLRLSNRFSGPIFRMQRALRKIAAGGPIERISLREDDYLHDFADDLNAALNRLSSPVAQSAQSDEFQLLPEQLSASSRAGS